ncbi:MAG: glycosyltransferase family 2 protein [SAR202 cluster bacterium]|nr:glycosyltransferase family 2 protein [SAR202 cluster bacterium]
MPSVDIVIPVLNEEQQLRWSINTLSEFCRKDLSGYDWRIIVADNGSTDGTRPVSEKLARAIPGVSYLYIPQRGRGLALRTAWLASNADFLSYMDVDLSTRLEAFPKMLRALQEGYDVAIGSRLQRGSKVTRSLKREVISRCYNVMIKAMFFVPFNDAQCGFKMVSRRAARALVPLIQNNHWFFDTELLIIASKRGFKIKEVPVEWVDDPDSRVKVVKTAWEDIKGLLRLRFGGIPRTSDTLAQETPKT